MNQTSKLIELKRLLDQGLIDQEEFLRLKNEILSQEGNRNDHSADVSTNIASSKKQPTENKEQKPFLPKLILIISLAVFGAVIFLILKKSDSKNEDRIETKAPETSIPATEKSMNLSAVEYLQPSQLRYLPGNTADEMVDAQFYPIGWSRDGKFAYMEFPAYEEADCLHANFYLQDLVSDKMIYKRSSRDFCEDFENLNSRAWQDMKGWITPILRQYQIVQTSSETLSYLPFRQGYESHDFHIYNRYGNAYENGFNVIEAAVISLKTNGQIGKKVFGKTYAGRKPLSNRIAGYLKSPFENRIAALYVTEYRGWEGPPNAIEFELIGCMIQ